MNGDSVHLLSFAKLAARAQRLRDDRDGERRGRKLLQKRIAVLGGFTTQFVTRVLDALLFELGVDATFYEGPYGSLTEQVLNPDSEVYAFGPDFTLLLVHGGNLERWPSPLCSAEEARQLARAEAECWCNYASTIERRIATRIVQSNFELPATRPLGNQDGLLPYGRVAFVRAVNAELARLRPSSVLAFDLEYLASQFGLERALDAKIHCLTKQPFSFDFLVPYCHALARQVALACGLSKKCAVLDLDGTLWGGTLAEDGAEKLVLGPDSAEGEAFAQFQRYLEQLVQRGVLLAVCSKNDEATAREAFASHPHMALEEADIACFVANWENKAENLVRIARSLNIGLDALVFVDNSPEERHLIRSALPEVSVVELPEDPAEYARALDRGGYFELSELTSEAALRTSSLVQNQKRAEIQASFVDYDAYLRSLELQAEVRPIAEPVFERCAELVLRSNQFNLRTVRHSEADLRAFLARSGNTGFCVALQDRFGKYGVISVVLLEGRDEALFVDTWLMSCRVLKKGVEQLVFQEIVAEARRRDVPRVLAQYVPTAKNGMVAGLLPDFGFERTGDGEPVVDYRLDLQRPVQPAEHFIQVHRPRES